MGVAAVDDPRKTPSLARDSGRTLIGTVVTNVANVLIILVIARALGTAAVGEYTLGFAVRAILVLACGLGMRNALTRFVAAYWARDDHANLRGSVRVGVYGSVACATIVAAVWFQLTPWLDRAVFGDAASTDTMRLFALSLPFIVYSESALAATRGFSTMRPTTWIALVLEPGLRAVLTALAVAFGFGVHAAAAALLASAVVTALASAGALSHSLRRLDHTRSHFPMREIVAFAVPSWVATLATQGLLWADVVILGAMASASEVGAYQVAARVVLVAMFVITPLGMAMAPRITRDWEMGDIEGLTRRYQWVVAWCTRLTWPLLAGVLAVPALVLEVFGPGFPEARSVIVLLAIGAAADAVGSPGAVLLNQIGRNRFNMVVNCLLLGANISLNLILIPPLGIEGSAAAWAFTMVTGAIVRVVAVRRIATSRWPLTRGSIVTFGGAVLAGVAAYGAVQLVPDVLFVRLGVAMLVVLAVYSWVLFAYALTDQERAPLMRELDLRVPALRRIRTRWALRHATPGHETIPIDAVLAPFRYDVLLRADLFRLAADEPELLKRPREFARRAREGGYGIWFESIVLARGDVNVSGDEEAQKVFETIVATSLAVRERMLSQGRCALGRVVLVRIPAGTELEGWRVDEDRYALLDGGHRVALAMLDGLTHLEPAHYVVVPGRLSRNNSAALLASQRVDADDVREFMARGGAVELEPSDA